MDINSLLILLLLKNKNQPIVKVTQTDKGIQIIVNGNVISKKAIIDENTLYLPVREVSEAIGYKVIWDDKEETITLKKQNTNIFISLKNNNVRINDHEMVIEGGYKNINDSIYFNDKFYNDVLNVRVDMNEQRNVVDVISVVPNDINIITVAENGSTNKWIYYLQYPQLNNLTNKSFEEKSNHFFSVLASNAKAEGSDFQYNITDDQLKRGIKAETYFNYIIKYNQKELLSIVFSDYQFTGGAHGLTAQSSYTVNINLGKLYFLKDLFKEDSNYIEVINDEIKRQMRERGMKDFLTPFVSIKPDQKYFLTNNALVIYFQQYEYFPYAYGIPEFSIDYSILKDLFKPEFAVKLSE